MGIGNCIENTYYGIKVMEFLLNAKVIYKDVTIVKLNNTMFLFILKFNTLAVN